MDVPVGCPCPGTPHPDGDTVTLRDKPTLHMGTTVLGWAGQSSTDGQPATGEIAELYLREGIEAWTFVDDSGEPMPVSQANLDWFMDDYALAYPVADAASGLYTDVIFAPLQTAASGSPSPTARRRRSSRRGQTAGLT